MDEEVVKLDAHVGSKFLKAFEHGADGVFVAGCLEGECHYLEGNLRARKKVAYVKKLLAEVQINPERIEMFNLSSAMGGRFAEIAEEMTDRIRELGPVNTDNPKEPLKP